MLQKRLDEDCSEQLFKQALIMRLLPIFQDIMVDQFGNYLTQKILEVASSQEIRQIINQILPSVSDIAVSIHGTRAIQFLVEILHLHYTYLEQDILNVIQHMRMRIKELSLSVHGNHVIQAFLTAFRSSENPEDKDIPGSEDLQIFTQFIFDACMNDCIEIGSHKHGCCVM